MTSRSSAGYITNHKYLYINKLYKNTHSFSLRSHGHSCDRVTIYSATILSLCRYKYLYISMLYKLCIFLALCGHMVTAVTMWPFITQQLYPYINLSICISACYTHYAIFLALCGHMVTAVTMWPFISQRNHLNIDISICISVFYAYYTLLLALCGHMVTAVTMWPWPCDRFVMT